MALTTILLGIATLNYRQLQAPAVDAASQLTGFLRESRSKALASTLAYTVMPASATRVITRYGTSCSAATQTNDPALVLALPSGASMSSTNWSICYNPRGLANASANIVVSDKYVSKTVQIVLGGGVRSL
jgi:Tfp pilus assembly protein FimT